VQTQIRRLDQMDERLFEWRRTFEEEIREKLARLETSQEQLSSTIRVQKTTNDDVSKSYNQRILKLETLCEEQGTAGEDAKQSIVQLHARLQEVEDLLCERNRTDAVTIRSEEPRSSTPEASGAGSPQSLLVVVALEAQVADATRKLQELEGESHQLLTRFESQEERFRTLRQRQDNYDDQHRSLLDRISSPAHWEAKLKDFQTRFQEMDKQWGCHAERLEIFDQKLTGQKQAHDELGHSLRRLQERGSDALAFMAAGEIDPSSPGVATASPYSGSMAAAATSTVGVESSPIEVAGLEECLHRVKDSEEKLEQVSRELKILRSDSSVTKHVVALVGTLQEVAPKLIQHDQALRELQTQVQDVAVVTGAGDTGHVDELRTLHASMVERVGRLESEVGRLVEEVEGPVDSGEYPDATGTIAEVGEDEQEMDNLPAELRKQRRASSTE